MDLLVYLRAERAGAGDARTYTITYSATDASGDSATASATVEVPHDRAGRAETPEARKGVVTHQTTATSSSLESTRR
jgi:hypothetical protein